VAGSHVTMRLNRCIPFHLSIPWICTFVGHKIVLLSSQPSGNCTIVTYVNVIALYGFLSFSQGAAGLLQRKGRPGHPSGQALLILLQPNDFATSMPS